MKSGTSVLDRMRIASPCPASWAQMTGDDRVRFCQSCKLHVYDLSQLTHREAVALIAGTEGRLCAKIYRRADGTVTTRDCPVGLRAIRRRVAKLATAAAVVMTTICANVFALSGRRSSNSLERASFSNSLAAHNFSNTATISGAITDPNGDPIQNARIVLTNLQRNWRFATKSNKRGEYHFFVSDFGRYSLEVKASEFQTFSQTFEMHLQDELRLDVSMMIRGALVGVVVIEPLRGRGFDIDGTHIRINE